MKRYLVDPVLNLTASALRIFRWGALTIMFLALFAAVITLVALLIPGITIFNTYAEKGAFGVIMPTAFALGYLLARFLGTLRAVVLSVRTEQPLTWENAARLRTMGWLWLALEAVTLVAGAVFGLLQLTADAWNFDTDAAFGLIESLLIAASLFILARVFEHGAEMREELEGTV